jgi:hypothetical protein
MPASFHVSTSDVLAIRDNASGSGTRPVMYNFDVLYFEHLHGCAWCS